MPKPETIYLLVTGAILVASAATLVLSIRDMFHFMEGKACAHTRLQIDDCEMCVQRFKRRAIISAIALVIDAMLAICAIILMATMARK